MAQESIDAEVLKILQLLSENKEGVSGVEFAKQNVLKSVIDLVGRGYVQIVSDKNTYFLNAAGKEYYKQIKDKT